MDLHTVVPFIATGVSVKIEGYETAKFQEVHFDPPDNNNNRKVCFGLLSSSLAF